MPWNQFTERSRSKPIPIHHVTQPASTPPGAQRFGTVNGLLHDQSPKTLGFMDVHRFHNMIGGWTSINPMTTLDLWMNIQWTFGIYMDLWMFKLFGYIGFNIITYTIHIIKTYYALIHIYIYNMVWYGHRAHGDLYCSIDCKYSLI